MTRRPRILAAVFALLHFTVAGFGPLVDARLEAREEAFIAHVESERQQLCGTGHDHLFCQLCRVIGVPGAGRVAPVVLVAGGIAHAPVLENAQRAVARLAVVSHGPRAPPSLFA